MKICGIIFAILYMGLMLFAVWKEKSKSISSALIVAGVVLTGGYVLFNIAWGRDWIFLLVFGMAGISAGTLINGFRSHNIHIRHHIIRLAVEAVIVAICWIGR